MHRYPDKTETTAEIAIAALEAHEALAKGTIECFKLWQRLSDSARKAAEEPDPDWSKVKALWLIADACSLRLQGDSTNEPFKPMAVFESGRSAVAEDFTAEDAALLSNVAERVANRVLRARLSDLAWIRAKPKQIADAHRAIDAYVEIQPTEEGHHDVLQGWHRAITLCMQLGKGARSRLEEIEADLVGIAEASIPMGGSLGLAIARALFVRRLGSSGGERIAALLGARGKGLLGTDEFFRARGYFGLAYKWLSLIHI